MHASKSAITTLKASRLFGLHSQVVLVALVLLVIPWVGYSYVKAIENLLREKQEQQVQAAARAIAATLQDRPKLLELRGVPQSVSEVAKAEFDAPAAAQATKGIDHGAITVEPLPPPPPPTATAAEEVRIILAGLARAGLRVWVIDAQLHLIATAGSLDNRQAVSGTSMSFGPIEKLVNSVLQPLFKRMFPPPARSNEEVIPNDLVFGGKELERALDGTPSLRRRPGPHELTTILSAVHPVWVGEYVVGAVVVEENTVAIVSLGNRALQQLAAVTLIAFAAVALVLLLFASRLSWRLRKLRDEAENAIDSRGRIRALVAGGTARDEIGDLSRAFSTMLERLAHYNAYLEKLAQRLSHELRTPIAVVRSSLDNVKLQSMPPDAGVYVTRAESGLDRLETILTRMAEATRLEQAVRNEERVKFDAKEVLAGCISGYTNAYRNCLFELNMTDKPVMLMGAPDLFAQMLDKLAANAADFATAGTPVSINLQREGIEAVIQISNSGPLLPAEIADRLFDSMISVRQETSGENPHLGLGLYIVRLIAEFHGGRADARNRHDKSGVEFEIHLECAN